MLKSVVFDFDYTLADSSRGAIACVNYAMEGMGLPTASSERICQTIGMSLPATFETLAGEEQRHRAKEFERLFMERAEQVVVDLAVLFATVEPTLRALKSRGLRLGIVSTKTRRRIVSILQREGLEGFFDVIIGGEDVQVHKPDPTGLFLAAGHLGCTVSELVYVGDSIVDAEAAQRGGIDFVAVLSGVTKRESFEGYGVTAIIGELSELSMVLAG